MVGLLIAGSAIAALTDLPLPHDDGEPHEVWPNRWMLPMGLLLAGPARAQAPLPLPEEDPATPEITWEKAYRRHTEHAANNLSASLGGVGALATGGVFLVLAGPDPFASGFSEALETGGVILEVTGGAIVLFATPAALGSSMRAARDLGRGGHPVSRGQGALGTGFFVGALALQVGAAVIYSDGEDGTIAELGSFAFIAAADYQAHVQLGVDTAMYQTIYPPDAPPKPTAMIVPVVARGTMGAAVVGTF
jgi:hypothetical protein